MVFLNEIEILIRLTLAVLFGFFIGTEREYSEKPAGIRTHVLVSIGSTIFSICSISFFDDPTRIAANIVTGIGFLGAGAILRYKGSVQGLTTASDLWATAAIGLALGIGYYFLSITGFVFIMGILLIGRITKNFKEKPEFLNELEFSGGYKKNKKSEEVKI